jgi:hypothetical protein
MTKCPGRVTCPKLKSYWHFHGCGYTKLRRTCTEPAWVLAVERLAIDVPLGCLAAKAPWKIQPDECCCPGKSDLSKPAIYTFNDPEWLGGNFEGHSPCGIFIALPTVTISLPIQQIEINHRNMD